MLMAGGHKIGKKYALEFQYNGGFRTVSEVPLGKLQSPQGGVAAQRSRAFMFVVRRSFK